MTSLERQLKRLKTPQTEAFRQQKYRASFLYDRREAAAIDCETHLRIANKGLKRLIRINPELECFRELFSEESKQVDRAVLQQDENEQLSEQIRKFINNAIVPYFMLNDCHECIEYLIYKYQVNTYQIDDMICAVLPYHETRLFARFLQVLPDLESGLWTWLVPYKKDGVPVPKERILSVLASKQKLPLVSFLGDKLIEINRESPTGSGIYTSFYTTTMMCLLDRTLDESFFVTFMPYVYKCVKKAHNTSLFMAGLVLIGYLAYTQELDESYQKRLVERLSKTHAKFLEKPPKNMQLLDEYYKKVIAVIHTRNPIPETRTIIEAQSKE